MIGQKYLSYTVMVHNIWAIVKILSNTKMLNYISEEVEMLWHSLGTWKKNMIFIMVMQLSLLESLQVEWQLTNGVIILWSILKRLKYTLYQIVDFL